MHIHEELSIKAMTISQIYSLYSNGKLLVNRKYQRKLCWTIEEKRNFLDTIMCGYPIPMFLFGLNESGQFEIIDGMQRLDTICSFVEQNYSLKNGHFNLETMPDTIDLKRKGILTQKNPVLSSDICKNISNYPLPVSVFSITDERSVEEIFKRINSTGKHLSSQELRQIGVNSQFAIIVRQLSTEIRGDVSNEMLLLNDMSKISLTNHRLPYSIFIPNMFWVKNGIINAPEIRQSRDEEALAYIIANMILPIGQRNILNSQILNRYYGYTANPLDTSIPLEFTQLNNAIDRIGFDSIKKQFRMVMSCIDELLTSYKKSFRQIMEARSSVSDLIIPFQVIFMAIHKLLIKENRTCVDYSSLAKKLDGNCGAIVNVELRDNQRREHAINSIYGLIQEAFMVGANEDPSLDDWTLEFNNIINKSKTEQNLYDFKIGLVPLKGTAIDKALVAKVVKTLSAINNIGPNRTGYVIIGVADDEEDAIKYKNEYNTDYLLINDFPLCGVEHDAVAIKQDIDRYTHSVKELIKNNEFIPDTYRMHLLSNMKTPAPYGKHMIVFKTCYNKPVAYDNKYYIRQFTDVNELTATQMDEMFKGFYKSK